jgi:hypothetical protein
MPRAGVVARRGLQHLLDRPVKSFSWSFTGPLFASEHHILHPWRDGDAGIGLVVSNVVFVGLFARFRRSLILNTLTVCPNRCLSMIWPDCIQ